MIIKKTLLVAAAASLSILGVGILTAPAHATGPEFTIKYEVQDVTIGTDFVDADDADTALHAAPGDTIQYRATIQNNSAPDPNGSNNVTLIVTYPNGTQAGDIAGNDTMTTVNVSIAPGKPLVQLWKTTVTSTTEDDSLYSAISIACDPDVCPYIYNDQNQEDYWNSAFVTVDSHAADAPATDATPSTTTTPTDDTPQTPTDNTPVVTTDSTKTTPTPAAPEAPAKMPNTGSSANITAAIAVLAVVGGYVLNTLRLRRSVR